jgi:tRNA/tmRNA/rRNA uracil-C5-methylase (TrmA/RlmC/RlmD family)
LKRDLDSAREKADARDEGEIRERVVKEEVKLLEKFSRMKQDVRDQRHIILMQEIDVKSLKCDLDSAKCDLDSAREDSEKKLNMHKRKVEKAGEESVVDKKKLQEQCSVLAGSLKAHSMQLSSVSQDLRKAESDLKESKSKIGDLEKQVRNLRRRVSANFRSTS